MTFGCPDCLIHGQGRHFLGRPLPRRLPSSGGRPTGRLAAAAASIFAAAFPAATFAAAFLAAVFFAAAFLGNGFLGAAFFTGRRPSSQRPSSRRLRSSFFAAAFFARPWRRPLPAFALPFGPAAAFSPPAFRRPASSPRPSWWRLSSPAPGCGGFGRRIVSAHLYISFLNVPSLSCALDGAAFESYAEPVSFRRQVDWRAAGSGGKPDFKFQSARDGTPPMSGRMTRWHISGACLTLPRLTKVAVHRPSLLLNVPAHRPFNKKRESIRGHEFRYSRPAHICQQKATGHGIKLIKKFPCTQSAGALKKRNRRGNDAAAIFRQRASKNRLSGEARSARISNSPARCNSPRGESACCRPAAPSHAPPSRTCAR